MISIATMWPGYPSQTNSVEFELTSAQALTKLFPDKEERDKLCLVYMGKVIPDDQKLSETKGLKATSKVYVMCKPRHNQTIKLVVDQEKLSYCKSSFVRIINSKARHHKLVTVINEEGMLERIAEKVPGLMQDVQSHAAIRDLCTITMILDDDEQTFVKKHPVIVDALKELFTEIVPVQELESEERLARDHSAFDLTAPTLSRITPQMMQQAMAQVFQAMSSGSQPAAGTSAPPQAPTIPGLGSSQGLDPTSVFDATTTQSGGQPAFTEPVPGLYEAEQRELQDNGYRNRQENIEVLVETGGDVSQALLLLSAMRASEFDT